MADSKPRVAQSGNKGLLLPILFVSFLGGVLLSGADAGGQTPQELPVPRAAEKAPPTMPGTLAPAEPVAAAPDRLVRSAPQFKFNIDPATPVKDLLPIPPKKLADSKLILVEDLSQVREITFQEPLAKTPEALAQTAHAMAKINHLNRQKPDGFLLALLGERPDLAGLPMAMGDACRMKGDRTQYFSQALNLIKQAKGLGQDAVDDLRVEGVIKQVSPPNGGGKAAPQAVPASPAPPPAPATVPAPAPTDKVATPQVEEQKILMALTIGNGLRLHADPEAFWDNFVKVCLQEDKTTNSKLDPTQMELVTLARIAALMQVMAPESIVMRKGLVRFLAGTSHVEATLALAKLAIFSPEDEVRNPAVDALKVRREKDYTEILVRGLRYPLPAVAKRAADAMVRLERTDLVPELVSFLEEPDPRLPVLKEVEGKKVPVMREIVRINHHRNCLMCHAPAVINEVSEQVTTAEVPRPDQPLPLPSEGYSNSIPDILVRLDVTYLRQDFSRLLPVADAHPWPDMQRFDYLVQTRVLTEKEAASLPTPKAGALSPYQRTALASLRELTGRDTAPTPEAWRQLLDLPRRE
jgi:hypothetical protein